MRREFMALIVCAMTLLLLGQPCYATVTIVDRTFANTNWTHVVLFDSTPGGGAFTAGQVAAGGNPGAYQGGSHTFGPGFIVFGHLFSGGDRYDPSTQGAIARLYFRHDFIVRGASAGSQVATALLLKQHGNFYVAPATFCGGTFCFTLGNPWESASQSLTVTDFMQVTAAGVVPGTPDFSLTGAPIQFGYVTVNSTGATGVVVTWGADNYRVTVSPVVCNGLVATIVGTADADLLRGTARDDVIAGLGGDDVIYGFGGDDSICGGNGNDILLGGSGHDHVFGGAGRDTLFGEAGNDQLFGEEGNDYLNGGSGDDVLNGASGVDVCDGGPHSAGDTADTSCEPALVLNVP